MNVVWISSAPTSPIELISFHEKSENEKLVGGNLHSACN